MSDMPESPSFEKFANYVVDTYVDSDSLFPPELWAAEPSELEIRTTNGAESYHRHLNDQFNTSHPHIFLVIDTLNKLQCQTYIKIRSLDFDSRTLPEVNVVYSLESDLRIGAISRLDYITRLGYKFKEHT